MNKILNEQELIAFMDSLGWIYGAYDDQHFHKFSGGDNSISNRAAQELYDSVQSQKELSKGLCKVKDCFIERRSDNLCSVHYSRRYNTPAKSSYYSMRTRCLNKGHKDYWRYGGSGITICERWLGKDGYNNFADDMGERPKGTTLDRIDGSKGYSLDNCRWADSHTQRMNQSRPHRNKDKRGRFAQVNEEAARKE